MPVHMDLSGAYNAIQFFDGLADMTVSQIPQNCRKAIASLLEYVGLGLELEWGFISYLLLENRR